MTSQEFEVKRRSRVARIWANRKERWAAWKAERDAKYRFDSHGELSMWWDGLLPGWRCGKCGQPYHLWRDRSCRVAQEIGPISPVEPAQPKE